MRKRGVQSDVSDKIHAYLKRCFIEAGLGSIDRVEEALGFAPGYFRKKRHAGSLQVSVLVAACRELGIRPGKFLDDALGESEHDDGLERKELPQARWVGAKIARERFLEEYGDDD